ncbi:MAG: hypothetical protein K0R59_1000 [Sphingobacterium sp.]|uniref:hypothetical protein n=1 Tax=Sphingobacterium sp. NGMCC 1.201703 TaxID=3388657 RepID=UPI002A5FF64C|nr:hypothetical protein [Sphingobacterium sp.]
MSSMFHKAWFTALLIFAIRIGVATAAIPQDTIAQSASSKQKHEEVNRPSSQAKETVSQTKEKVIKSVPKARNQQIPRPVIPRINSVNPDVRVKVKTKINTNIRIKL